MDHNTLLRRLRKRVASSTQAKVATELGVSAPYLCDILKGRRELGPKVLLALGYHREVRYLRADER